VAKKRVAPHICACTIRLTRKEKDKVLEYCNESDLTISEYFRYLARTHLKINPDIDMILSAAAEKKHIMK